MYRLLPAVVLVACRSGASTETGGLSDGDDDAPLSCEAPVYAEGDLTLTGPDDLQGLCATTNAVQGTLTVSGGGWTDDLGALGCLCTVTGALTVQDTALTSLDGLANLDGVDGDLVITGNPRLASVEGLDGRVVGGGLQVASNDVLVRLLGLSSVTRLAWLDVSETPLVTFRGLEGVSLIEGDVTIRDMGELESFEGLGRLERIEGQLTVERTGEHTFQGLDALYRVSEGITVSESEATLEGLDALTALGGPLDLYEVHRLRDLSGLGKLHTISGQLRIRGADTLNSLAGAERLQTIANKLWLENTNVRDFSDLAALSSYGGLYLHTNPELETLADLPPISTASTVFLQWNPKLLDLAGLDALGAVTGDLRIDGHVALADVGALYGVGSVGGDFTVVNNVALTDAQAQDLLVAIGEENVSGTITISGNGN